MAPQHCLHKFQNQTKFLEIKDVNLFVWTKSRIPIPTKLELEQEKKPASWQAGAEPKWSSSTTLFALILSDSSRKIQKTGYRNTEILNRSSNGSATLGLKWVCPWPDPSFFPGSKVPVVIWILIRKIWQKNIHRLTCLPWFAEEPLPYSWSTSISYCWSDSRCHQREGMSSPDSGTPSHAADPGGPPRHQPSHMHFFEQKNLFKFQVQRRRLGASFPPPATCCTKLAKEMSTKNKRRKEYLQYFTG